MPPGFFRPDPEARLRQIYPDGHAAPIQNEWLAHRCHNHRGANWPLLRNGKLPAWFSGAGPYWIFNLVQFGSAAKYAMDVMDSTGWHMRFSSRRLLRNGTAYDPGAMESYTATKCKTDYKNFYFQAG